MNQIDKNKSYVIFSSFGNDSVALIRWALSKNLKNVVVAYSNTQWAAPEWEARIETCVNWLKQCGYNYAEIKSEGFKNMVRRKKGFPRQGYQYCTGELKILPAIKWLEKTDPKKEFIVLIGVRRAESNNRKNFPRVVEKSPNHGERMCIAPLVDYTDEMRDKLLEDSGFTPLKHRSMECYPCINANRNDIKLLAKDKQRIEEISEFEKEMGFTAKGKPRTMYRPYRHMGAVGIKEVVDWANSPPGKYDKNQKSFDLDDGTDKENEGGCLDGWCGI